MGSLVVATRISFTARNSPAFRARGIRRLRSRSEEMLYELVLARGRVIDPETGLDAVRDVGLNGGSVAAISEADLSGAAARVLARSRNTSHAGPALLSLGTRSYQDHVKSRMSESNAWPISRPDSSTAL